METLDNLTTLLATVFTVLFSAGAWKFYESRLKLKTKDMQNEKNEQNMYRDDLRERVKRLEKLLTESSLEKDQMRDQILNLTREVSELRVKVTFLEKENERLKNK
jgi:septal ring factor EnvC (AmiA/AmiB activator)